MIEARRVTANGVKFHCATAGEGPLVLLLHGFPERWFSWEPQIEAIAARGYRVVAPDLRGYGLSDRPADGYDIATLAADVAGLIRAHGEARATVIGHDWGGAITWCAAERHPEAVARYAVLNCPHPWALRNVGLFRSPRQLARSWYILFFGVPWLPEQWLSRDRGAVIARMLRRAAVDRARFTPERLARYRDSVRTPEDARTMVAYYRAALRDALKPMKPPRPIAQPGLLLWAEEDIALGLELIPEHLAFARDLRVERIPGCGHFVQQERPEEVTARLLRWMADTDDQLAIVKRRASLATNGP